MTDTPNAAEQARWYAVLLAAGWEKDQAMRQAIQAVKRGWKATPYPLRRNRAADTAPPPQPRRWLIVERRDDDPWRHAEDVARERMHEELW